MNKARVAEAARGPIQFNNQTIFLVDWSVVSWMDIQGGERAFAQIFPNNLFHPIYQKSRLGQLQSI